MKDDVQPVILLVGGQGTLSYLLGRFAEHCGYQLIVDSFSVNALAAIQPAVMIFLSTGLLEMAQSVTADLSSVDIPIIVCGSATDQAKAKNLGADYCLLHPLTYDDFQTALTSLGALKRA